MWLLSTDRAKLKKFQAGREDQQLREEGGYAILSHVWEDEEIGDRPQSFEDMQSLRGERTHSSDDQTSRSLAHPKLREFCILAEQHGYRWAWIDTCCINNSSSAELQEAINSMFDWYAKANICYAYLADVSIEDLGLDLKERLRASKWFTRG